MFRNITILGLKQRNVDHWIFKNNIFRKKQLVDTQFKFFF